MLRKALLLVLIVVVLAPAIPFASPPGVVVGGDDNSYVYDGATADAVRVLLKYVAFIVVH